LTETFDGKHLAVDGPDGNTIDCMFFPCTTKEKVFVDEGAFIDGKVNTKRQSDKQKKELRL